MSGSRPHSCAPTADTFPRPLRTVSIRVRVIAGVMAALALVLLGLSFTVQSVFAAQSERNLEALLTGRAQLARQLARSGARPQQIVNRVGVDGVLVSLRLRDGTVLGDTLPTGTGVQTVTTRLVGTGRVDDAALTLSVNSSLVAGARTSLQQILVVGGLVALISSSVLVGLVVHLALRPLNRVAALAQDIATGSRGGRLSPSRTDTEIGRTAYALDKMLDELEGAERRARHAEERTRSFLADAAHELRTPLAGIRAAAETLLQHRETLGHDDQERLEVLLVAEAERSGRLVGDMLTLARFDTGATAVRSPVDVSQVIDDEVARARLLSPQLSVTVLGSVSAVNGDGPALRGVLRNLLDNARRAAGTKGAAGTVQVTAAPHGPWAVVQVLDNGPGVPIRDRERVFDRFVRLDPARDADSGGTGLGLAISRETARAHGGDLTCLEVTHADGGAVFQLVLPLLVTGR